MAEKIVNSGIDGLDSLLEKKGFPKGSSILVLGAPGTGKSILGMQYIYKGVTLYNDRGIYAVFHEHPDRVRRYMLSFGWDIDAVGRADWIMIIDATSPIVEKEYIDNEEIKKALSPGNLIKVLKRMISETKAERVVIDSLSSMYWGESAEERKLELLQFAIKLSALNCTTLIISEAESHDVGEKKFPYEAFLFDGMINLYLDSETKTRRASIRKMRGTKHALGSYRVNVAKDGIEVLP